MKQIHQQIVKSPARSLFVWFLGLIAIGTVLLSFPICHTPDAEPFSLSDAAFTATSASCVTGLSVRSTAHDFSFIGQLVILLLIQLGGLGIITVATVFVIDLTGRTSADQRAVMEDTLGLPARSEMTRYVNGVVIATLVLEGIGALVLIIRRLFVDDPLNAVWWGTFHSISAFCNAGFALDDDSLSKSVTDPTVNLTIVALILAGGLGYPVIRELLFLPKSPKRKRWASLSFHSKLTLTAGLALVAVGSISFWLLERNNTLSELSFGGSMLASLFQGVTPRTAGFNTLPFGEFSNATLVVIMLLMIIGGNSCSTAGGTKVSTFSVFVLDMLARLRGKESAVVFGCKIPQSIVAQTGIVVLAYLLFATIGLIAIVCIEQSTPQVNSDALFIDAMFEVLSALATVGLSTGFTSQLSEASRWIIISMMFAGRIGPLAVVAALSLPKVQDDVQLPEANPYIG